MMENVKNLVGNNHLNNFKKFLDYLCSLGYKNYWSVLNARDYGVPQNRERVFCISILGANVDFTFPNKIPLNKRMNDYLENDPPKSFYLSGQQFTVKPIEQDWIYCLDSNYWKGTFLKDFLEKRRRQVVSCPVDSNGVYPARRLTPLETWRFMGVSDEDYYKASTLISNTSLYKQSGNSIVVPVLEAIFTSLFKEDKKMDKDKQLLIEIFRNNIKGKMPDVTNRNIHHDGRKGNWLEEQFGKSPDADNYADFFWL